MADKDFVVKNGLVTGTNNVTFGNSVYIVAGGNVGIHNSAPAHDLSINGPTFFGGDIASSINLTANTTGVYHTGTMNAASHTVGTSTIANATGVYTGVVNAASHTVGTNTIANATGVYTGVVNGSSITVGTSTIANATGVYTGVVNAASHTVGTSTIANATGVYTGVVNAASHTVGTSTIANATGVYTGVVNGSSITVGTSFITNTTGVYHTGTMNAASHTVGTSTIANATGVYTGVVNAASHTVGTSTIANATGVYTGVVNAASHTVGTNTIANATGVYTGVVNGSSITVGTAFTANATLTNTVSLVVSTNTATIGATFYSVANGNVGIGTATPNSLLTVVSTGSNLNFNGITGVYNSNQGASSNGTGGAGVAGYNANGWGVIGGANNGIGVIGVANTGSGVAGYARLANSTAGFFHNEANGLGVRVISNTGNLFIASNATANLMGIYANGNVGIGTTTPNSSLVVISNSAIRGGYLESNNGTGLEVKTFTGSYGIIGISVTPGNSSVAIYGLGNTGYGGYFETYGVAPALETRGNTGVGVYALSKTGRPFVAANTTTEFMNIYANGNVGIGTGTPSSKLEVSGTITSNAATIGGVNFIDSNGGQFRTSSSGYGVRVLPGGMADSSISLIQFTDNPVTTQRGTIFCNATAMGIGSDGSTTFAIRTNAQNRLTISAAGDATFTGSVSATSISDGTATLRPLVPMTSVALTTQSTVDFTSIPSWVRKITVIFYGVSLTGSDVPLIQLGTSGGFVTTGYASYNSDAGRTSTSGFIGPGASSGDSRSGIFTLALLDGVGAWVCTGICSFSTNSEQRTVGYVNLAAALTQVRLTRTGTNTFDAGSVNVIYE